VAERNFRLKVKTNPFSTGVKKKNRFTGHENTPAVLFRTFRYDVPCFPPGAQACSAPKSKRGSVVYAETGKFHEISRVGFYGSRQLPAIERAEIRK